MTNRLTEQQLQEELLDEIGDFTKAITKKIGQGVGAVTGAGQKVKGVAKRSVDALGKSFQQGKQQTQKAVAGQDYKAPQPKAQTQTQGQGQGQGQGQTKTKPTGVLKNLAKNLGDVAVNTAAGTGYDYRQGVNTNPTKQVPVGKQDTQAQTQTQAQATKRTKTGGKVAGQVSNTASAQAQRDRRAAKKGGSSAVSKGIDQAQIDGANQGVANMQKQQTKLTPTKVPGQKKPTSTAQNVGKNAGVNTAKIGGQKVDLNDPKMKGLRAAIEKAAPGSISAIDKMQPADKAKLKKAIA